MRHVMFLLIVVVASTTAAASQVPLVRGKRSISLFTGNNRQGRELNLTLKPGQCFTLPKNFNGEVTSLMTNNECYILYTEDDCQGISHLVTYGVGCHENLAECGFNNKISSIRRCPARPT